MKKFSHLYVRPVPKRVDEKTTEFHAFHSGLSGRSYHMSPSDADDLHEIKHGGSSQVEVAHHNGNLKIEKMTAHRIGNTIHLHDEDGNHVDSFHHTPNPERE